jgi:hypothetical protein
MLTQESSVLAFFAYPLPPLLRPPLYGNDVSLRGWELALSRMSFFHACDVWVRRHDLYLFTLSASPDTEIDQGRHDEEDTENNGGDSDDGPDDTFC